MFKKELLRFPEFGIISKVELEKLEKAKTVTLVTMHKLISILI